MRYWERDENKLQGKYKIDVGQTFHFECMKISQGQILFSLIVSLCNMHNQPTLTQKTNSDLRDRKKIFASWICPCSEKEVNYNHNSYWQTWSQDTEVYIW